MTGLLKTILLSIIRCYRFTISCFLGHCCRFEPSCSSYALDAIQTHGSVKGLMLSIRRILRCHPWSSGGLDPVPKALNKRNNV